MLNTCLFLLILLHVKQKFIIFALSKEITNMLNPLNIKKHGT